MMDVSARAAVLQALRRPLSGQEIVTGLTATSHGRVRLLYGSLYPALRRLEGEKLVRSWVQRVGRGRPRRNYELTPAGVQEAERVRDGLRLLVGAAPVSPRTPAEMAEAMRRA